MSDKLEARVRTIGGLNVEEIASHIHLRYDAPTQDLLLEFYYKPFITVDGATQPFSGDEYQVIAVSAIALLTRDLGTGVQSGTGHVLNGINGQDVIALFKNLAANLYDERYAAQQTSGS